MVHIATVHWLTDKWIDIQQYYLRTYIKENFKVYSFLSGEAVNHSKKFFYSSKEYIIGHAKKLNILSDIIKFSARNKNDILIFLDGDAFPIGNIMNLIYKKIEQHKLLALKRTENCGDIQPHPAFCATTVGFWNEINGDWKGEYTWKNQKGKNVRDIGSNLLQILKQNKINWYALKRSNKINIHPLLFGIYDDVIYHHGAGFRTPSSRIDFNNLQVFVQIYLKIINKLPDNIKNRYDITAKVYNKNQILSNHVYSLIKNNPQFFNMFLNHSITINKTDNYIK